MEMLLHRKTRAFFMTNLFSFKSIKNYALGLTVLSEMCSVRIVSRQIVVYYRNGKSGAYTKLH